MEQLGQGGGQAGQDRLGLGVAEAHVELDHAQAVAGQRQPAVEQADEGGAAPGHLVDDGLGDLAHHPLGKVLGGPGQRRVRAHAAGVGAGVAVGQALEVLGGRQRTDGGAVAHAEHGGLRAVEVVLDDDGAVLLGQAGQAVVHGGGAVGGDDDALAGGQAVLLDHVRRAESVQRGGQLGLGGAHGGLGGGHARGRHDLLGEGLGALQAGRPDAGAEHGDAGIAHGVGDPRHEGGLRAHDDEVGAHLGDQLDDLRRAGRVDGKVGGHRGGPRIARGDDELGGDWV